MTARASQSEMSFPLEFVQMEINLEAARITHLFGLDGVPVELCFMSQNAHRCIDVARISVADAGLQFQVHVFEASRIFFAEYLRIDRRLPIHRLVICLENRTFADAVIGRELDAVGKWRQRLSVALADAADV